MLKSKRKLLLTICLAFVLFVPVYVYAAGLVPCGGPAPEKPCTVDDAFYGVARVTNWLILIAGIYAVYNIVSHSFWLVVSMGNEEAITKHKTSISQIVQGFFLVVAAFMLVNTVVNYIFSSKCKVNFASPLSYVTLKDPSKCIQPTIDGKPNPDFNPANTDIAPKGN